MSSIRNPVGPQSSRVYWRRRIMVLLGLVLVIVVISLIVNPPGEKQSPAAAGTPTAPEAPDATAGATDDTELVEGAECPEASIRVTANIDKASFGADEKPQLTFTVDNTNTVACTVNLGTTQQTFVVSSGEEQYWSSKDCETAAVDAPTLLEPNTPVTSSPLEWNRTRSSTDTCSDEAVAARAPVPAGGATYRFAVSVGAVESEPVAFILN